MNTSHVGERAIAYCNGELSAEERASIEAHIRDCDACRADLADVEEALGALARWPENPALDPALEQRVMSRVRAVAGTAQHRTWRRTFQVAAALVVAVGIGASGFWLGRTTRPGDGVAIAALSDSTLRSYLLLLEEPVWPPTTPLARAGYGDWARAISDERRFVEAEKLTEEPGFRLNASGEVSRAASSPNVSGWYVIKARSYDDAISWARRGPHLAYGSVLVREIEDTPRTVPRVQ